MFLLPKKIQSSSFQIFQIFQPNIPVKHSLPCGREQACTLDGLEWRGANRCEASVGRVRKTTQEAVPPKVQVEGDHGTDWCLR